MMTNSDDHVLYLSELINDRERLSQTPGRFKHVERLVDQEIVNVRSSLFDGPVIEHFELPLPYGEPKLHKDRVYIPDSGRKFNFVGRLLGPRGKTLKRIEQDTGCKIMIRGEGSVRNANNPHLGGGPNRYDAMNSSNYYPLSPSCYSPTSGHGTLPPLMTPNGGMSGMGGGSMGSPTSSNRNASFFQFSPLSKASPPHHGLTSANSNGMQTGSMASISSGFCTPFSSLFRSPTKIDESASEPLHVLIQCEDTPNRAKIRLDVAKNLIMKLFQPVDDAHDELKQKQLLELSLMNGTFKASPPKLNTPRKQWPHSQSKSPSFSLD